MCALFASYQSADQIESLHGHRVQPVCKYLNTFCFGILIKTEYFNLYPWIKIRKFLSEQCKSDEQNIFRGNIQAYLTILDNVDSKYNATPKLRKHMGSVNQSNIRKAILEKSCERPQVKSSEPAKINSFDEKFSANSHYTESLNPNTSPKSSCKCPLKKLGHYCQEYN